MNILILKFIRFMSTIVKIHLWGFYMTYILRRKIMLRLTNIGAILVCGIFLFFTACFSACFTACSSVPAQKENISYIDDIDGAAENSAQNEAESGISVDDADTVKKVSGKKKSGKTAKKLTVIYDEEKKEEPDFTAEYKALCADLKLTADNLPAAVKNGNAFDSDFSVFVANKAGLPVEKVSITVKYPSHNLNGSIVYASEDIVSDAEGKAVFTSPLPEFSCLSEILFYVTPEKTDEAVLKYAEENALHMPYRVYTDKTHKVISVSVADYTPSGKPVTSNSYSSSALLKALYKKGFRRVGNADFIDEIDSGNTKLLYKNSSALFSGAVDYLIFGTVKYEKPVEQNAEGLYTVTLNAELSLMEMKSGTVILNTKRVFTSEHKNEWQLLDNIRNTMMAPEFADFLYYNF